MTTYGRTLSAIALTFLLLAAATGPVAAQPNGVSLPPLPEWPIIGPILRLLGVTSQGAAEVPATPDPSLPEHRIETMDDVRELGDIEAGESVRVVISDTDLNTIVSDALAGTEFSDDVRLKVDFRDGSIAVDAFARADVAARLNIDVPIRLPERLNISAVFTAEATDCAVTLTFDEIEVNGWRAGLKQIANRAANEQVDERWPDEACVEQIIITDGEVAVEGYRR